MYAVVLLFNSNIAVSSRDCAIGKERFPNTIKKRSNINYISKIEKRVTKSTNIFSLILPVI